MNSFDPERLTVSPDGRPEAAQPRWRQDFPIDWPQDEYIARRDFTKFMVLTSLAFVVGHAWIVARSLFGRRPRELPWREIASVDAVAPGQSLVFQHPVAHEPALLVRKGEQPVWEDRRAGFVRRSVSPPHAGLRAELVEGRLTAGADIAYDRPPVPGLEQHIRVLEGALDVTVQEVEHHLGAVDCLRMRVWGPTRFRCPGPGAVRYALAVVLP